MDKYIFEFDRDAFTHEQVMALSFEECMSLADKEENNHLIKRTKIDKDASLERCLDWVYMDEHHRCFGFSEEEPTPAAPADFFTTLEAWREFSRKLKAAGKDYIKEVLNQVPDHEVVIEDGPIVFYNQDDAMQAGEPFGLVKAVYLVDADCLSGGGEVYVNTTHFVGHRIDNILFTEEVGAIAAAVREEVEKTDNL